MRWIALPLASLLVLASACGGAIDGGDQPENCGVARCGPEVPAPEPPPSTTPSPTPSPQPSPAPNSEPAQQDPDLACPAPYHGVAPDGRCVWSCSEGTEPDDLGLECVCRPGLSEVSTDAFGRRVCR